METIPSRRRRRRRRRRPSFLAEGSSPEAKRRHSTSSPVVGQETYTDHLTEDDEEAEYQRLLAVAVAGPSPQQITFSVADRIEGARQYLDFFYYLQNECAFIKTDSNYKHVYLDLIMRPERKTRFNKLDEETILQSIYEHIRELEPNEIIGNKLLGHPDFLPIPEERHVDFPAESRENVGADMPTSPVSYEFKSQLTEEEEAEYQRLLAGPSPQQIMISFVDRVQRAHQYFEFFDFLQNECAFIKTDSNWKDVFLDLIKKPERNTRFNKLDEETIMDSIYERIRKLQANEVLGNKLLGHPDYPPIPEDRRLEMYHQFKEWRQVDHIPFTDPILELINQARKGHLLDHNPQVALDKIQEYHPLFYEATFTFQMVKPPIVYSEKTVTVMNLTAEHTDEKLKDLLAVCGEVEKIERTSSFVWSELAHVTFKNSEAARIAPLVVDPHLISLCRKYEPRAPESIVEKVEDVGRIYKRAVNSYTELSLHYAFAWKRLKMLAGSLVTPCTLGSNITREPVRNFRKSAGGKNVSPVVP